MLDTFQVKTASKKLIVKNKGLITLIAEYQGKGKKPKLVDMAFGSFTGIIDDLRGQGYQVSILK